VTQYPLSWLFLRGSDKVTLRCSSSYVWSIYLCVILTYVSMFAITILQPPLNVCLLQHVFLMIFVGGSTSTMTFMIKRWIWVVSACIWLGGIFFLCYHWVGRWVCQLVSSGNDTYCNDIEMSFRLYRCLCLMHNYIIHYRAGELQIGSRVPVCDAFTFWFVIIRKPIYTNIRTK
jgi:hypothetical protein